MSDQWRREFHHRLRELEKTYGKGLTYTLRERNFILSGVVPEWVFRGVRVAETKEQEGRCKILANELVKLHREIFPEERTIESHE